MPEWNRNNVWRQGQVLSETNTMALGLIAPEQTNAVAVLISHDCDIANDITTEPNVEFVLAWVVEESNANYKYGKNPRFLEFAYNNGQFIHLEMQSKTTRSKNQLLELQPAGRLQQKDVKTLQNWLAARYSRSAFPDDFDQVLKAKGVAQKLYDWGKTHGAGVTGLLFDLSQSDGRYELAIVVLYGGDDPLVARGLALEYSQKIIKVFKAKFFNQQQEAWETIELQSCIPVSEDSMTITRSREFQRWNLDAVSFATDPHQPLPPH